MVPIREVIYCDRYFKRQAIRIGRADAYFWIEQFVEQCHSTTLARSALEGIAEAVETSAKWCCNYNDIIARYDPAVRVVSAEHELDDISTPPVSQMPVTDFIRILSTWEQSIALASDTSA